MDAIVRSLLAISAGALVTNTTYPAMEVLEEGAVNDQQAHARVTEADRAAARRALNVSLDDDTSDRVAQAIADARRKNRALLVRAQDAYSKLDQIEALVEGFLDDKAVSISTGWREKLAWGVAGEFEMRRDDAEAIDAALEDE